MQLQPNQETKPGLILQSLKALMRGIFDVLTGIEHCLTAREFVVQWLIGSSASIFGVTSEE